MGCHRNIYRNHVSLHKSIKLRRDLKMRSITVTVLVLKVKLDCFYMARRELNPNTCMLYNYEVTFTQNFEHNSKIVLN